MTAAEYHADPTPEPSLSSSIVKILCSSSPAHAQVAHPRLNPQAEDENATHFDIGTVAHAILLEGADVVQLVDAPDWRTKIAQAQRDAARAKGKVPLLKGKFADVEQMVAAASEQLAPFSQLAIFNHKYGKPEQTVIWKEDDVWCRARIDWLHDDHTAIDDYKSTSASANPDVLARTMFANGWDTQAAWYLRGLRAVGRAAQEREFRFVVQETYAPYALSVIGVGPDVLTIGEKKALYALERWRICLRTADWPAYPTRVCYPTLPAWEENRWLEKELR